MPVQVIGLAGSPRRGGNTETLLDQALAGAASVGAATEKIVISRLRLSPCRGCERCFETGRCVIQDDYQQLYDRLLAAEGVIVAAPIYFVGVNAQTKAMIDRCQCLWARRYVLRAPLPPTPSGLPRWGGFVSAAGDARTDFACAVETVRAFFATLRARYAGDVFARAVDERGEVQRRPELLAQAFKLGVDLIKKIGGLDDR